jgi:hypothetical protein
VSEVAVICYLTTSNNDKQSSATASATLRHIKSGLFSKPNNTLFAK